MHEIDLRALVRDAVERHLTHTGTAGPGPGSSARSPVAPSHPAQALYLTLVNATDDCVIEPSVRCTHCGYCKTHGY